MVRTDNARGRAGAAKEIVTRITKIKTINRTIAFILKHRHKKRIDKYPFAVYKYVK